MLYPKLPLFSILYAFVTLSKAQHNVTVNNTSPSIQYEGKAGDAVICKINLDGNLVGSQGGCYNAPSQCTKGASMGLGGTSDAASFSFKGSAIYIDSLLNFLSPIYTVTLDGNSTDVDGVRPSGAFICGTLFSQTGLDPNVEHKVQLSAKGPSPNRNTTFPDSEKHFVFSLISYTFTEDGNSNTTSAAGGPSLSANTTANPSSSATSPPSSSAQTIRLSGRGAFVAIVTTAWALLF